MEQTGRMFDLIKKYKKAIIIALIVVIVVALILVISEANRNSKYETAIKLVSSGDFAKASSELTTLGSYKESEKYVVYCNAKTFLDAADYNGAIKLLSEIPGFLDSDALLVSATDGAQYVTALTLLEGGDYEGAKAWFGENEAYKDAKKYIQYIAAVQLDYKTDYKSVLSAYADLAGFYDVDDKVAQINEYVAQITQSANELLASAKFDEAEKLYTTLGDAEHIAYIVARRLEDSGDYSAAADAYKVLSIEDSADRYQISVKNISYKEALADMDAGNLSVAYDKFSALEDFGDSAKLAIECKQGIDYASATALMEAEHIDEAIATFTALGDYKDSKAMIAELNMLKGYNGAVSYQEKGMLKTAEYAFGKLGDYKDSVARLADVKSVIQAKDDFAQGNYEVAEPVFVSHGMAEYISYIDARQLEQSGDLLEAAEIYKDLTIEDSAVRYQEALNSNAYTEAIATMRAGDYAKAAEQFTLLGDYRASRENALKCKQYVDFEGAKALMEAGKLVEAHDAFTLLGDFNGSAQIAADLKLTIEYHAALALKDAGKLLEAYDAFVTLGEYSDSAQKAAAIKQELLYNEALVLKADGKLQEAYDVFVALGEYSDSIQNAKDIKLAIDYAAAQALMDALKLQEAYDAFVALGDYSESTQNALKCKQAMDFAAASELEAAGDIEGAIAAYKAIGDEASVSRVTALTMQKKYNLAIKLQADGRLNSADYLFSQLGDYEDSAKRHDDIQALIKAHADFASDNFDAALPVFEAQGLNDYVSYIKARQLEENGDTAAAAEIYGTLTIADSAERAQNARNSHAYNEALANMRAGDYALAYQQFIALGDYRASVANSIKCVKEMDYASAKILEANGDIDGAIAIYTAIDDEASLNKVAELKKLKMYNIGVQLQADGKLNTASTIYQQLGEYQDSATRLAETQLQLKVQGVALLEARGDIDGAITAYTAIGDEASLNKAAELKLAKKYQTAITFEADGKLNSAIYVYEQLGEYQDSAAKVTQLKLKLILQSAIAGDYEAATKQLNAIADENPDKVKYVTYVKALSEQSKGRFFAALKLYREIPGFEDVDEHIEDCVNAVMGKK